MIVASLDFIGSTFYALSAHVRLGYVETYVCECQANYSVLNHF